MEKDNIYKNVCQRIKYFLDQNKIDPERYFFELTNSSVYNIEASYTYEFKVRNDVRTIAGGKPSNYDYHHETDFINNQNKLLNYANNPKEKETYIKDRINNPIDALSKQHVSTVWESAQISYHYQCNTCHGSGLLTCSSCNGQGKKRCFHCSGTGQSSCSGCGGSGIHHDTETYYEHDGTSHTRNVTNICHSCGGSGHQTCFNCGGSGKVTCGTCHGSGEVTCHSCSGHGFFRKYCTVYTEAHKNTVFYYHEKDLYVSEIINLLTNNKNIFYVNHFDPSLIDHKWGEKGTYILSFAGEAHVVEISITLDNKVYYNEAGVNTIESLIYPNIFDYLLKSFTEIHYARNEGLLNFIKYRTPLRDFFNYRDYKNLKENPTIAYAFEVYSLLHDKEITEKASAINTEIRVHTGYLISEEASKAIAMLSAKTMNSVAPHTTKIVWWLTYIITILIEVYFTFNVFDNFIIRGIGTESSILTISFAFFAYLSLVCAITFGFIAPIASITNKIITKTRQMAAEKQHRPKVHNRKHLQNLFKINVGTFIFTILGMYLYKKVIQPDKVLDNAVNHSIIGGYLKNHKNSLKISNLLSHKNAIHIHDYINNLDKNLLNYFHNIPAWLTSIGVPVTSSQFSVILPLTIIALPLLYLFFLPTINAVINKRERKLFMFFMNLIIAPMFFMVPWIFLLYLSLD